MNKQIVALTSMLLILVSGIILVDPSSESVADPQTTGTVTIGSTQYNDLATAVTNAADGDQLILSEGVFTVNLLVIEKNISLIGKGQNTVITNNGAENAAIVKYLFKNGFDVRIESIQFKGYGVTGLLCWSAATDVGTGDEPKLTVTECTFRGQYSDGYSNAGIGFFGCGDNVTSATVSGCLFDHNKEAVYLDDAGPQPGLKVTIRENIFVDSLYSAVYGVLTDVDILDNVIDGSNACGVDFILNGTNSNIDVKIEGNVIDSTTAISIAPYKLNNGTGSEATVVDASDLPRIKNNIREKDNVLVNASVCRQQNGEKVIYAPDSIDVNNNYTAGSEPTVNFGTSGSGSAVDPETVAELIGNSKDSVVNDTYFVDRSLDTTNNDVRVPPVVDDDDDEFPFLPGNNTPQNNPSSDKTTLVAAAAAVVVIMLAVVAMIVNRNH